MIEKLRFLECWEWDRDGRLRARGEQWAGGARDRASGVSTSGRFHATFAGADADAGPRAGARSGAGGACRAVGGVAVRVLHRLRRLLPDVLVPVRDVRADHGHIGRGAGLVLRADRDLWAAVRGGDSLSVLVHVAAEAAAEVQAGGGLLRGFLHALLLRVLCALPGA